MSPETQEIAITIPFIWHVRGIIRNKNTATFLYHTPAPPSLVGFPWSEGKNSVGWGKRWWTVDARLETWYHLPKQTNKSRSSANPSRKGSPLGDLSSPPPTTDNDLCCRGGGCGLYEGGGGSVVGVWGRAGTAHVHSYGCFYLLAKRRLQWPWGPYDDKHALQQCCRKQTNCSKLLSRGTRSHMV